MKGYKLDPALSMFLEKLHKLLRAEHSVELIGRTFLITLSKGKFIKKEVMKISQTENLVGIDIYLDNIDDKCIPDVEHMISHLENMLEKKDVQLVVNKIEL